MQPQFLTSRKEQSKVEKKYYTKKEVIEWAIKEDAKRNIRKAFKHYGIEGTEEAIKRVYKVMPKLKSYMLETYKEVIENEKRNRS